MSTCLWNDRAGSCELGCVQPCPQPISWFEGTIGRDSLYEVAKARAEISFKFHIGCTVARNITTLIAARFGPNAA